MSEQAIADRMAPVPERTAPGSDDDPLRRLFRRSSTGQDADELAYGQGVIVTARWILVVAGLVLALWKPLAIGPLRVQVLVLLLIAVGNFFLHAQLLKRRGPTSAVVYAASAADLAVITLLVASQHGYDSHLFAFYFPALLAISVAFEPRITAVYTGSVLFAYGLICLQSLGVTVSGDALQTIVVRLIALAAIAFCGALCQQVEAIRREQGIGARG